MKITKLTSLILSVTMLLCILTSCSNLSVWRYGVTLYDQAGGWIQSNFATENYVIMGGTPNKRTFIVDTQEKYNEIFIDGIDELKTDFSNRMLIVHTRTFITKRDCWIKNVKVENGNMKISYVIENKGFPFYNMGDGSSPYQRWMVLILDKIDIESVEFEELNEMF